MLMKLLALDTAQGACSAAVWIDGAVVARRYELMRAGHAELLVPMLMEAMEEAGLEMADLSHLACTIGPGTFTGTRVALSTLRGMALALKVPMIPVTTLEAVAHGLAPAPDAVRMACFDAKRGELYVQVFAGMTLDPLTEPEVLNHKEAAIAVKTAAAGLEIYGAGTGMEILEGALKELGIKTHCADVSPHPDAALVAEIAAGREGSHTPPAPLYLRAPDAKLPAPK